MSGRCEKMKRVLVIAFVLTQVMTGYSFADDLVDTVYNPVGREYRDEVILLRPELKAGQVVISDGVQVPFQVIGFNGKERAAVLVSLPAAEKNGEWPEKKFRITKGTPAAFEKRVKVYKDNGYILMDNGIIAVRIPAEAKEPVAPVDAVRLPGGKWVGRGMIEAHLPLKEFTSTITGNGTVFGEVTLVYEFAGADGLADREPVYARVRVRLSPGHYHVEINEEHSVTRESFWEFALTEGWKAARAQTQIFGGGAGRAANRGVWPRDFTPLGWSRSALDERYENGDPRLGLTLMWLVPRWNQHYQDGWFFAAEDDGMVVGALVCNAGEWIWPHSNKIEVRAKESGDYAGLRCPWWKGARTWFLVAGQAGTVGITEEESEKDGKKQMRRKNNAHDYVRRYAWETLDNVRGYILEWPGVSGRFSGEDFYSSGVNPTGFWRQMARNAVREAGKVSNSIGLLTKVQVMFDPDMYGTYWNYWSPQNPNFFTDFIKRPIALTCRLKEHPRFAELAEIAEKKLREDMYHSITLPGGAGQECPGYQAHALKQYEELAELCRKHLGFDPSEWPRYQAGRDFLWRISQPRRGGKRVFHPGGDTHPGKDGPKDAAPYKSAGAYSDPRKWRSEEFPGFGAILRNQCGTDRETYLAFKSGPNRGHYHGDQLSIHYCNAATPLIVDHHCSYNPRAGQEHMHNRLVFTSGDFEYANMDGYERLIAFKAGNEVDIAVGQVESERLRWVKPLPPENWDRAYPQIRFDVPLRYRRTVVLVKGDPDYVVLRDQYDGPEVTASFAIHAYGDAPSQDGAGFSFSGFTLYCAAPERFQVKHLPWEHGNGGGESTQGLLLSRKGSAGEFITVIYPGKPPVIEAVNGGVKVGNDNVVFDGGIDNEAGVKYVAVKRDGKELQVLNGTEINPERSQGEIGLFVPDAGYPFGEIPDWLIRQRTVLPDWMK